MNFVLRPNKRSLNEFVVSNGDGDGIKELGSLNSIGGDLTIYGLQNVKGDVARSANLEGKPNLRSLNLRWNLNKPNLRSLNLRWNLKNAKDHEMVLEGLQPHSHLKSLDICNFGGTKLPTWMGLSSCLPNLVVLKLKDCIGVEQLPSLGELPLLRILYIERMEGVRCLGKEFHGTGGGAATATRKSKAAFPSLKEFTLEKLINLEEWVVEDEQQQQFLSTTCTSFPHLEKLNIWSCPRLKVVPTRVFPSLTGLSIREIKGGMTVSSMVTRNLTSLTKVYIYEVEELQFLPQALLLNNNSILQFLAIFFCPNFEGFIIPGEEEEEEEEEEDIQLQVLLSGSPPPGTLHHLGTNNQYNSSLEYLRLSLCPVLTFLPDLRYCNSLRELTIEGCQALPEWVEQQQQQQQFFLSTTISSFPHLESLRIIGCPRLIVAVTFFPSLKKLYVDRIRDIIFRPTTVSRNLAFLVNIYINAVEELQFLPQGLLLNNNSTLQSLRIENCSKFEGFVISKEEEQEILSEDSPSPDLMFTKSSLKSLTLRYCPVLTFLPDLCYFTSLRSLLIIDCQELIKSLPDEDELKKSIPWITPGILR